MAYRLSRIFIFPIIKLFIKKIYGIDNLPKKGPFIIAANHESLIDGALIMCAVAEELNKKTHFYTAKEHIDNWLFTLFFVTIYGCIKTNGSLKTGLDYLKEGGIVGMFPESERTHDGKIQLVKRTGLGVLALISKAPVVPIGIKGAYEFWPRHNTIFRLKRVLELNIGKPIKLSKKLNNKNINYTIKKVMQKVAKLSGQEYPQ